MEKKCFITFPNSSSNDKKSNCSQLTRKNLQNDENDKIMSFSNTFLRIRIFKYPSVSRFKNKKSINFFF